MKTVSLLTAAAVCALVVSPALRSQPRHNHQCHTPDAGLHWHLQHRRPAARPVPRTKPWPTTALTRALRSAFTGTSTSNSSQNTSTATATSNSHAKGTDSASASGMVLGGSSATTYNYSTQAINP